MQSVKQIVHDIADHLPDQASFDDAMYALYVRQKLERSLKAAEEGKITSQEEMEKRYLNHEGRMVGLFAGMIWTILFAISVGHRRFMPDYLAKRLF